MLGEGPARTHANVWAASLARTWRQSVGIPPLPHISCAHALGALLGDGNGRRAAEAGPRLSSSMRASQRVAPRHEGASSKGRAWFRGGGGGQAPFPSDPPLEGGERIPLAPPSLVHTVSIIRASLCVALLWSVGNEPSNHSALGSLALAAPSLVSLPLPDLGMPTRALGGGLG